MSHRIPIREPEHIRQDAACKVRNAPISDEFRAILGCLLDEAWTMPKLIEIIISPDDKILVRLEGDDFFAPFLGKSVDDLLRYIRSIAKSADLDGDEVGYLVAKVAETEWLRTKG